MPKRFTEPKYVQWFFPLRQKVKFLLSESGYAHLQASKPDTVGIALSNNPVGLAAYILEKFSTFTNPANLNTTDGGLEKDFGYDSLLDNVMIYYLTNSITTSMRIYYESTTLHELSYHIDRSPVVAPFGCIRFKYDAYHMIDWAIIDKFPKLIHKTYHEDGGHFAALQLPDVLSADIVQFASRVIKK
jgi:juvenile hormone epoxide hydrolase